MAEHIRQSNLIEGINDEAEDRRSMQAWLWLRAQEMISHQVIMDLQGMIVAGQDDLAGRHKGAYRDVNVRVGSHVPPPWQLVPKLMAEWLALRSTRTAWESHCAFEDIHPFADGNGRTGRMLLWYEQVTWGNEAPRLIRADERQAYYARLSLWRDMRPLARNRRMRPA
jgi:Fic family protein